MVTPHMIEGWGSGVHDRRSLPGSAMVMLRGWD
jgi:hypothetical protein